MKVILKEDVENLGIMGAVVDVANGYGRNYLLPRDLAVEASTKNIKFFEHQKKNILVKAQKVKMVADDLSGKLSAISLSFDMKAGEEDKLFGSVTTKDIAEAITKQGIEVDRKKIVLAEPIKRLGSYDVTIKVQQGVTATVKVEVNKAAETQAEAEPKAAEAEEKA